MMGSSMSGQISVLESILTVVANKDQFIKNIEALKEKLIDIQNAKKGMDETFDKTKKTLKDLEIKEAQIKDMQTGLDERKATLDAKEVALSNLAAELSSQQKHFTGLKIEHTKAEKDLDAREAFVKSQLATVNVRGDAVEKAHSERMGKLDAREDALIQREDALATKEQELQAKINKLKALAE